ncbi:MAG: hypothetical protein IBJ16_09405 [Chitinophagaceae bacterium]|nr:hypothetical protein [Chitinophagaceae bacterium]
MKKISIHATVLMMLFSFTSFAQMDTTIQLDNFRMPTTPAASILNMGTQAITRPTLPKGFATSLLSGLGGSGLFNPNINIEFAPYWLKPQRKLSFAKYYQLNNGDKSASVNIGENMLRSLAISVATSKLGDNKDSLPGTRLSVGVRTQLFSGEIAPQTKKEIREIDLKLKSYDIIQSSLTVLKQTNNAQYIALSRKDSSYSIAFKQSLLNMIERLLKVSVDLTDEERIKVLGMATGHLHEIETMADGLTGQQYLSKLIEKVGNKTEYALQLQKFQETDKNKVGFFCEVAFAGIQYLGKNSFSPSSFQKAGVWTTLTYRSKDQKSEFAFVGRHFFTNNDSVNTNTDFGVTATRVVSKGFNYGLEWIYRSYSYRYYTKDISGNNIKAIQSGSTYRLNIVVEYQLSEVVSLTASVGKDFNGPFTSSNNFLSVVGANLSLPALIKLTR